jgi:hypothetical protein
MEFRWLDLKSYCRPGHAGLIMLMLTLMMESQKHWFLGFEVLTVVVIMSPVFWDMTICGWKCFIVTYIVF